MQPEPLEAPPHVIQNAISDSDAAELREYLDSSPPDWWSVAVDPRCDYGPIDSSLLPSSFDSPILRLARQAGDHFGLPVNLVDPAILRYNRGANHPGHRDLNPAQPESLSRTVSLSVLLSQPVKDFTGGGFETCLDGPVDASLGDAIAITSTTRHRIATVESGLRYVVVAFGMWIPEPA